MSKIKVLIVDDSVVYRSQIRAALEGITQVEVVGAASNGRLALERLSQTEVDLMILDLEMPEKDGLDTMRELAKTGLKCQVILFASESKRAAHLAMEAMRLGASDFIVKPSGLTDATVAPANRIRTVLEPKIRALFSESEVVQHQLSAGIGQLAQAPVRTNMIWDLFSPQVVVIGSSTGGPNALEKIFENYSGYGLQCPILITQHMPPVFTAALAERLSKSSGLDVREGVHGEVLENQRVYIAPGDFHMSLSKLNGRTTIALSQTEKVNSVRPAVDILFESAAAIYKERCMGIVLTGMGADGKVGSEHIKASGGAVVIQDEASCVVFGMPGAVYAAGAYDRIANPKEIRKILEDKVLYFGGIQNVSNFNHR